MKKIYLTFACVVALCLAANHSVAQNAPSTVSWGHKMSQRLCYFYFPSANIYFDAAYDQYIYKNGNDWLRVTALPESITLEKTEKPVRIDYIQDDVYYFNEDHRSKYQNKAQKLAYAKNEASIKGK